MPSAGVRALVAAAVAASLGLVLVAAQKPSPPASPSPSSSPSPAAGAREDAYRANNLGVAYLEQYNYEEAAKSFRRALEIDSGLTLARINLSIALLYVPDLPGAAREAQAALQAQPGSTQARYVLGLAARGENRVEDGVAAFQQVLATDPRDAGALVNLGQLFLQQRKFDEAMGLFRRAMVEEPFNATATYNLGVALMRAGQQDEGQRVTTQFQALRESGYGVTYSNTYLEQGRYAEALASTGAEPDLVNPATPAVAFAATATINAPPPRPASSVAPATGPGIAQPPGADLPSGFTLVDYDRDGDLDLVDVNNRHGRIRLFANDAGRFTDISAKVDFTEAGHHGPRAVIAGDYDNDGRTDLLVLMREAIRIYRQTENGQFGGGVVLEGNTLPRAPGRWMSVAFADVDHDGDLDIVLLGAVASADVRQAALPPSQALLRNNGDGTFADITSSSKLDAASGSRGEAIVPTDYDNRRDLDLLFLYADRAPALFRNMRDGTFKDEAVETGLASALSAGVGHSAIAAGDVNKDGYTDFFLGRGASPGVLVLSDGNGRFRAADAGPAPSDVIAVQFLDYDSDGLLDLAGLTRNGLFIWRNTGAGWRDVSEDAAKAANDRLRAQGELGSMAAGDIDGDGDTDIIVKSLTGTLTVLTNQGGSRHTSLRVQLTGQVSNRSGVGAKVDMRAGSLRQKLESSSAAPAIAPADLVFGLGARAAADVVRVIWPSGTVQAEPIDPAARGRAVTVKELDRKPSSCPFLYTWNGERFEFITDFMGGGEMGYLEEPGLRNTPDPEEFTRITDAQLRPRNGRYELRVTNELEETLFIDHLRLLAVAHPAGVEIYPREGLFSPPFPTFEVMAARDPRPPARVLDHAGRDVTDKASALDRRYVDGFPLAPVRGYAKPHTLTIEAGDVPGDLLLLTGWTDYAFSSDNVAASQAGLRLEPPTFAVLDDRGRWRTIHASEQIGIPVGRPQTIVLDLHKLWRPGRRAVRISTSMRIYWDQIRIATRARELEPESISLAPVTTLVPIAADLRWRGFSAEATRDEPFTYDYARVSPTSPWKQMPGRYTREGDVRELLQAVDDTFVIARPGDEVALSFEASALSPLPAGWTRTFLLHSDGFSKEMDLHSASPDQAWPLPFHGMTHYPYAAPEAFPFTPERRAAFERYNTRIVSRAVPSLDALAVPPRPRAEPAVQPHP